MPENNVFLNNHHVVDKTILDHFLITCDINMRKPVTIFKGAIDRDKFRCEISCALQTADIYIDTLNTILRGTLNRHAPAVTREVTSRRHAPWFNSDVKTAKQKRRAAEKKWVKTGLQVHCGILMSTRKRYNSNNTTVYLAKRQYYLNKFSSAESCKQLFRATDELLGKDATPPFPAASPDQLPSY